MARWIDGIIWPQGYTSWEDLIRKREDLSLIGVQLRNNLLVFKLFEDMFEEVLVENNVL